MKKIQILFSTISLLTTTLSAQIYFAKDTVINENIFTSQTVTIAPDVEVTLNSTLWLSGQYNQLVIQGKLFLSSTSELVLEEGKIRVLKGQYQESRAMLSGNGAEIMCRKIEVSNDCFVGFGNCNLKDTRIEGLSYEASIRNNIFTFTYSSTYDIIKCSGIATVIGNELIAEGNIATGGFHFYEAEKCIISGNKIIGNTYVINQPLSIRAGGNPNTGHIISNNEIKGASLQLRDNVVLESNQLERTYISVSPTNGAGSSQSTKGTRVKISDNYFKNQPFFEFYDKGVIQAYNIDSLDIFSNLFEGDGINGKGLLLDNCTGSICDNTFKSIRLSKFYGSDDGMIIRLDNDETQGQVRIEKNTVYDCGYAESDNPKSFSLFWLRGNVVFTDNQITDNVLYGYENRRSFEPLVRINDEFSEGERIIFQNNYFTNNSFASLQSDNTTNTKGKLVSIKLRKSGLTFAENLIEGDSTCIGLELDQTLEAGMDRDSISISGNIYKNNRIGIWATGAPNCSNENSFIDSYDYHIYRNYSTNDTLKALRNYWGTDDPVLIDAKLYDDDEIGGKPVDFGEIIFGDLTLVLSPDNETVKISENLELEVEVKTENGDPRKNKTIRFVNNNSDFGQLNPVVINTDNTGKAKVAYTALKAGECKIKAIADEFESNEITITNEAGLNLSIDILDIDPGDLNQGFIPGAETNISFKVQYTLPENSSPGNLELIIYQREKDKSEPLEVFYETSESVEAGENIGKTLTEKLTVPWVNYNEFNQEIVVEASITSKSGEGIVIEKSALVNPAWHKILNDTSTFKISVGVSSFNSSCLFTPKYGNIVFSIKNTLTYLLAYQNANASTEITYYTGSFLDEEFKELDILSHDSRDHLISQNSDGIIGMVYLIFDGIFIPYDSKWLLIEQIVPEGSDTIIYYKKYFPVYESLSEGEKIIETGQNTISFFSDQLPVEVKFNNYTDKTDTLYAISFEGPYRPDKTEMLGLKDASPFFQLNHFYQLSTGLEPGNYSAEITITYDPEADFPEGWGCPEDSLTIAVWDTTFQQLVFIPTIRDTEANTLAVTLTDLNTPIVIGCSGQNITNIVDQEIIPQDISVFPNPFSSEIIFSFHTEQPTDVRLEIYNLSGQQIRTMNKFFEGPGINILEWDGKDQNSDVLVSGIYLYRIITRERIFAGKIVKME